MSENNVIIRWEDGNQSVHAPIVPASWQGKVIITALLCLFFFVTTYKITNASMWFDEGVEYLVSIQPSSKMIPAINETFQPPLYNFLMHFLFKVSTGEYWFRFTSALFGLLGCFGLYAAVNEACGWKVAGASIFFYTFLRNSVYYNQECAEYSLVIGVSFWAIYFFVCLLKQFSYPKAVGFTALCILAIYSQYGAAFPLTGLSLSLLLFYAMDRQWRCARRLVLLMGAAVTVFGIPLYFCFTRFQLKIQRIPQRDPIDGVFDEIGNLFHGLQTNFTFWFPSHYENRFLIAAVNLVYVFAVGVIIWSIVQRADRRLKYIGLSAAITYLVYCLGVRLGVYAYGGYGSRYVLEILPVILVCVCVSFGSLVQTAQCYIQRRVSTRLSYVWVVLVLMMLSLHNYDNWLTIQKNWSKENVRAALNLYLEETNGTDEIYLYYGAVPAFAFYAQAYQLDYGKDAIDAWGNSGSGIDLAVTQHKNYHYGEWMRGKSTEYMKDSIRKSFSNDLPNSLWFMLSHINADQQTYMEAFAELGYGYQVYRWQDARLLRLYNASYLAADFSEVTDHTKNLSEYILKVDQIMQTPHEDHSLSLQFEGSDPKIYINPPQPLNYDDTRTHKVLIEFTTEYQGKLQLFYQENERGDFVGENVVNSPYVVGHNRVFVDLPENAKLEALRLDMNHADVKENAASGIILSQIAIYEAK